MKELTFQELIDKTKKLIHRFQKIEEKPWGIEGNMIELSKQVGELSKLVMMHEKYYFKDRDKVDPKYKSAIEDIGDELSDILFMIIRIADHYNINIEEAHIRALAEANEFLDKKENESRS